MELKEKRRYYMGVILGSTAFLTESIECERTNRVQSKNDYTRICRLLEFLCHSQDVGNWLFLAHAHYRICISIRYDLPVLCSQHDGI